MASDGRREPYVVAVTRQAQRDLADLPGKDRDRMLDSIEALAGWPHHGQDVKKLRGDRPRSV